MRWLALVGLLCLACSRSGDGASGLVASGQAAPPTEAGPPDLTNIGGELVTNSGPLPCVSTLVQETWLNRSGGTLNLWELRLWIGTDFGFRGEIGQGVYRLSDGALLLPGGSVDRHAEPSRPDDLWLTQDYRPRVVRLASLDGIVVQHTCLLVTPTSPSHYHVALTAFWGAP